MTLFARLIMTLVAIGTAMALPAFFANQRLEDLRDLAVELRREQADASASVGRAEVALGEFNRLLQSYVVAPDSFPRDEMWTALGRGRDAVDHLVAIGYAEAAAEAGDGLSAIERASSGIETLLESGQRQEATTAFQEAKPLLAQGRASLAPVRAAIDRRGGEVVLRAERIARSGQQRLVFIFLTSFVLSLWFGYWITRSLTQPIRRLQAATARVAQGEFDQPVDLPVERRDELGDLGRSFAAMTAELGRLERLRAEFVSLTSHELRTPLNVIGGYAELLDEGSYGAVTEKQRVSLRTISGQVDLLSGLVNQLLDLSRFEAGAFHLQMEDVPVRDLLQAVEQAFEPVARQREIEFATVVHPGAPAVVTGDTDRLRNEVLGNLLSNAFKFTPAGGKVFLRATGADGDLRIEVEDTGPGIPEDERTHVFEKFYRGVTRAPGMGLGLAIARDVVRAHGGRIGVESAPGGGATLWCTLPGRPARQPAPRKPVPRPDASEAMARR